MRTRCETPIRSCFEKQTLRGLRSGAVIHKKYDSKATTFFPRDTSHTHRDPQRRSGNITTIVGLLAHRDLDSQQHCLCKESVQLCWTKNFFLLRASLRSTCAFGHTHGSTFFPGLSEAIQQLHKAVLDCMRTKKVRHAIWGVQHLA